MIIKASAALRNDYTTISNIAKETKEPIYGTHGRSVNPQYFSSKRTIKGENKWHIITIDK